MPENIRNIIYRFSQELRRILGDKLTKIIVYGSYARGDFRENSDIDIMILVKMSDEEIRLVKNDIYDWGTIMVFINNGETFYFFATHDIHCFVIFKRNITT